MKNRINLGFALVELLAVIVILALLLLVTATAVSSQFKNSKDELYDKQLENIKLAASMWGSDNKSILNNINECTSISLGYLKDSGYVDANIKNTYTGELFEDNKIFVNITKEENRLKYEVFDDSTKACSTIDEINGGDTNEE